MTALALREVLHRMAAGSEHDERLTISDLKETLVARTDEQTITLGDVARLSRRLPRSDGEQHDVRIEVQASDHSWGLILDDVARSLQGSLDSADGGEAFHLEAYGDQLVIQWPGQRTRYSRHDLARWKHETREALRARVEPLRDEFAQDIRDDVEEPLRGLESIISHVIDTALAEAAAAVEEVEENVGSEAEVVTTAADGSSAEDVATTASDSSEASTVVASTSVAQEPPEAPPAPAAPAAPAVVHETEIVSIDPDAPAVKPAWVEAGPEPTQDGGYRVTIHGGPHVNLSDCEAELDRKRQAELVAYAEKLLGPDADEQLHLGRLLVEADVEQQRWVEVFEHPQYGPMYNVFAEIKFDRRLKHHLEAEYHDAVVGERLTVAGSGAAMVLALLGAAFGFLKLDTQTRGYYRGRLAAGALLVTVTALVLGGGIMMGCLPMVPF